MSKEEIKEYLKRIDELGAKLTGEDKETYAWLVYGYNQCAKWLNETEEQCKRQKEVIDKIKKEVDKIFVEGQTINRCLLLSIYENIWRTLKEVEK